MRGRQRLQRGPLTCIGRNPSQETQYDTHELNCSSLRRPGRGCVCGVRHPGVSGAKGTPAGSEAERGRVGTHQSSCCRRQALAASKAQGRQSPGKQESLHYSPGFHSRVQDAAEQEDAHCQDTQPDLLEGRGGEGHEAMGMRIP